MAGINTLPSFGIINFFKFYLLISKQFIQVLYLLAFFACISCTDTSKDAGKSSHVPAPNILQLNILAEHYEKKQIPDSAFYYHNATKSEYLKNNDDFNAAIKLLRMAEIQLASGDNIGVENTIKEALPLFKETVDEAYLSKAYTILATAYSSLLNHEKALFSYKKAHNSTKDPLTKTDIMYHIARTHTATGNYNTAISILNNLIFKTVAKDQLIKANILDLLGYSLFKQSSNLGLDHMLKALDIRQQGKNLEDLFLSHLHLSEYYGQSNPDTAKDHALKAYTTAVQLKKPDYILQSLILLIPYTSGDELKKYSNEYLTLDIQADKTGQIAKNQFDKVKNGVSLQDNDSKLIENADRALLLKISSDHNKLLLISLVFTIFCSVALYYFIRLRHKKERFMEVYSTETRIAKKVHDEIANEIYGTINYLTSDDALPGKSKEKLISQLDNIYLLTKNISRETNNVDTSGLYPEYLKLMLTAYTTSNVNVIIKGISDIDWESLDEIKKIATYRSLQELMVNMKKHSNASLVLIDFSIANKKIEIRYSDNGCGAEKEQLFLKNGLLNVENRMVSIDGSVIFDNNTNKGFHITLTYPANTTYVSKNFNNRRH